MNESDVIVVGAGGSGLAAAARCAELGLSVTVLEKQTAPGGTTGIAVGSFTANGTSHQQKAGVSDSLDDHACDAGKFADPAVEARNNSELRRFFLSQTAQTLDWLKSLGLAFHGPSPEPPNRVARMHNVVPNAKAYIAALQSRTLRHGGQIIYNASVQETHSTAGRVSGIVANVHGRSLRYSARLGVVLAAGDYASSAEMISRFKGQQYSSVEGINPHAKGDGHRLVEFAGGQLLNMDVTYGPELRFVAQGTRHAGIAQLFPASGLLARLVGRLLPFVPKSIVNACIKRLLVTWQHPEDGLFESGAILINHQGNRFCDECISPERELAVARQPGKEAFLLLDKRLCQMFSEWPNFISTAPEIAYAYVGDYLKLRPDVAVAADTLDQLAGHRGLSAEALMRTVDNVNSQRSETESLPQLQSDGAWVLLGPLRAYFTTTEGGAAINQQFEVLNDRSQPIPGLYAVGQNGLGGQILWGHGLHIAWAITSGRLVAEHLAASRSIKR